MEEQSAARVPRIRISPEVEQAWQAWLAQEAAAERRDTGERAALATAAQQAEIEAELDSVWEQEHGKPA